MSDNFQLEKLRRMLMDPGLKSGLYLIDTALNDKDIEIVVSSIDNCKYIKEALMPSKRGSTFEMFVTGLSQYYETEEIKEMRRFLMIPGGQKSDTIIYNLLLKIIGNIKSGITTVIHVYGELDFTKLSHEELNIINVALLHYEKIVVLVCKKKDNSCLSIDPIINYVKLSDELTTPILNAQIKGLLGPSKEVRPVRNEAYFNHIAEQIISELDEARVSIHVCVAWFTNQRIADKLIEKFNDDVDVKVVSFDDYTNAKFGVNIEDIPHKRIKGTRGGTMHDKFCVIDNQKVITGSYNWSDNAENRNDENAAVMHDDARASDYSVEFRRLFSAGE